ncbi:Hypothetical predicted protein [Octopus vulgaris]|uniref:Lebercilin domain-containing protein n=1 Tax=Octopus vulgaris TaxID=6645 RepID=A0AA36BJV2_OCTVU|nr:Hypothetical predicted protein [Octopus vulgaris]
MSDSSSASQSSEENEVLRASPSEKVDNYSECFESDAESEVTVQTKQSSARKTIVKKSHNHQKMKRPSKFSLRITPSSDVEQKILSVRKLHNNELRNMNGDLLLQIEKQKEEIRLLKRMELRQAKIIEKFDNSKNKLPSLIDSHNKELKMLREQIRSLKFRYRKSEESLREADAELERTKNKLNKYKILLEEEQLIDRAELTRKLILAEQRTEESEKKIQNLQSHTEHLVNNHKHEINIEKSQNKKLKVSLQNLEERFSRLELQLLEKEKELEVWNIYSNRQKAVANKLNGSFNTPRSTPSVKNKFNEKIPPMTPPFHRIKKYEELRRQKELKRAQEKLAMKNPSTAQNAGDIKSVQDINHPSKAFNTKVLMSEKHGHTEKIPEKTKEESKEREKKEMKFTSDSYEQEPEIAEWMNTDNKQMEKRKEAEKISVNDDLGYKLKKIEETKPKEAIPKKAPEEPKQVPSDREKSELKQKQDEERRKKDLLLAKLKEIDDNPEVPLKSDSMFSNEDVSTKADNKTHYSFSQKTENLHQGRPVNEHNSKRNSPLTLNGFSEKVTEPLDIKNDLLLLKDNSIEDFFTNDMSLASYKPANEFKGRNGDASDAKWHEKSVGKNKNSIFKELFEDTPQDNLPSNGDFLGFKYSDGDSNLIGSSEPNVWDVGDMLRNDSRNNEKHSTKLLPSRPQMNRFEKRSTLDSLDNSMDSVEEIIL